MSTMVMYGGYKFEYNVSKDMKKKKITMKK